MINNIYGFGTHHLKGEDCIEAVTLALKSGYNLIDTAEKYYNSVEIGKAIKRSNIKRADIIIVHKLTDVLEFSRTQNETVSKVFDYLHDLDTSYIDVLLMHGPSPRYHSSPEDFKDGNIEVWKTMQGLKKLNRIKAIGVSNFHKYQIMYLIEETGVIPDYIEVEFNSENYKEMTPLIGWCQNMGIKVIAYSPIVAGDIQRIEKSAIYNIHKEEYPELGPVEFALRFCLSYSTIPIPRSSKPENIIANLEYLKKGGF